MTSNEDFFCWLLSSLRIHHFMYTWDGAQRNRGTRYKLVVFISTSNFTIIRFESDWLKEQQEELQKYQIKIEEDGGGEREREREKRG